MKSLEKFGIINNAEGRKKLQELSEKQKYEIIKDENCPEFVFEVLANDESFGVKCNVANSIRCNSKVLKKMYAKSYVRFLRITILKNPNCPLEVLEDAIGYYDTEVANEALAILKSKNV